MQGHGHPAQPARERDAGRGKAAKADDPIGLRSPHDFQEKKKPPQLRNDAARQPNGRPRKTRAGHPDELEMRVFLDQPRIHLLLADKQRGRMTAGDEPLGQRNARGKMSAGPAAGNEKPAHASTSCIERERPPSAARPHVRWVLSRMPRSSPMSSRLESPALMNGSDIPLVGNTPVTTPRLIMACRQISSRQPVTSRN